MRRAVLLLLAAGCASAPEKPRGVLWAPSPNFNDRDPSVKIDAIVIHTTEGSVEEAIAWFQNPESQVSAHFVIAPDGRVTQMVPLAKRAWHATYYNHRSIGIEVAGHADRASTWTPRNFKALVGLTAWLCHAYDIPAVHPAGAARSKEEGLDVPGLVAHAQVQPWNRSDPGPHFAWPLFVGEVRRRAGK